MKSAASPCCAAGPAAVSGGRRIKPGRSVQRQVSQSTALAPKVLASMSATIHRRVIARSSDSRTFRNVSARSVSAAARKKVFL